MGWPVLSGVLSSGLMNLVRDLREERTALLAVVGCLPYQNQRWRETRANSFFPSTKNVAVGGTLWYGMVGCGGLVT